MKNKKNNPPAKRVSSAISHPPSLFGKLSPETFLKRHWQKKALLTRRAFREFPFLISPDELAGLACEPDVVSRIILERGGKHSWELRFGPFRERDFAKLPKTHWTLLVQGVDRLLPNVHHLLEHFTFLPNWRIEDVMISYAPVGGNVGAHIDNFDVFLIQAAGTREWQITDYPIHEEEYVSGLDIRLLKKFRPNKTWRLEPGDMLYLPPRFAHHGISQSDDCLTYSVGFRAPTVQEILGSYLASVVSQCNDESRYADPDLVLQEEPGEISCRTLKNFTNIIETAILSPHQISEWLGRFVTEPKGYSTLLPARRKLTEKQFVAKLQDTGELLRAEGVRIAFHSESPTTTLFLNGEAMSLTKSTEALAPVLSRKLRYSARELAPFVRRKPCLTLLSELTNAGFFYFPS